jgi:hypothetical protein
MILGILAALSGIAGIAGMVIGPLAYFRTPDNSREI